MQLIGFGLALLCASVLSGITGPRLPHVFHWGCHDRRPPSVRAVAADDGGRLRVSSRGGVSRVKLGAGRHGLEVWSDDRGNSRVSLGEAVKVTSDERGRSRVRVGGLEVDSDGSD